MAWTYVPRALAVSPKDQVRLLIGDTQANRQLLQDEEISFLLTTRSSVYGAAAECCQSIASGYASQVDQHAGGSSLALSQAAKAYTVKAVQFNAKAAMTVVPYAGGISISDKQLQELNDDRVSPQFNIGMFDDLIPFPPTGPEVPDETTIR